MTNMDCETACCRACSWTQAATACVVFRLFAAGMAAASVFISPLVLISWLVLQPRPS